MISTFIAIIIVGCLLGITKYKNIAKLLLAVFVLLAIIVAIFKGD